MAGYAVRPGPTGQHIVVGAPEQHVGPCAAVKLVVALTTFDPVVSCTAHDGVVPGRAEKYVRTGPAGDVVVAAATIDPVAVIVCLQYIRRRGAATVQVREDEIGVLQVIEHDSVKADRPASVCRQVDRQPALVRGDGQVREAPDRERAQVDPVFPGGEVRNHIIAVIAPEYERIGAGSAGQGVVVGCWFDRILVGHHYPSVPWAGQRGYSARCSRHDRRAAKVPAAGA